MADTSPCSQYLEQQRAALQQEISRVEDSVHSLRGQYIAHGDRLQAALGDLAGQLVRACAPARARSLAGARRRAWPAALSLAAPAGPGTPRLACWIVLVLGALVLASMLGLGWKAAAVLLVAGYAGLVRWGLQREAGRLSRPEREAIDAFASLQPLMVAVHAQPSGEAEFPYAVTLASMDDEVCGTRDCYRLNDRRYGQQFGATFLGLGNQERRILLLSRLELDGFAIQTIPFGDFSEDDPRWPAWSGLAEELAVAATPAGTLLRDFVQAQDLFLAEAQREKALRQRLQTLEDIGQSWSDVALPVETLDGILQLVDSFRSGSPIKGILLYGPPGTGKTLIARKLARHSGCHFVAAGIADLKSEHIGGSGPRVKEIWKRCREHAPTILFVDECESVFASRGSNHSDAFGAELVQTFLSEWDGFNQSTGQVLVIGATNRRELLDGAVMSRFTEAIEIGVPDADGRQRILAHEFGRARLPLEPTPDMVRETAGMSGRDIHTLVSRIASRQLHGPIGAGQFLEHVRSLRGKQSTGVERLSWDDLILPESTLAEFRSLGRELVHAEELRGLGVAVPRGILLAGPPGTGKTQLARVLACESGLAFIAASSSELKAGYTGQSGGLVRQLFEKARGQAPCILFLDEIDAVAPSRGDGDAFTGEIVAQLLQELDGVATRKGQVFVLAASNHPDRIDAAVRSRFERRIAIGLPDEAARAAILALQLVDKPVDFDIGPACTALAAGSEGLSGRDLQSLVTTATRRALQRAIAEHDDPLRLQLTRNDLESALPGH